MTNTDAREWLMDHMDPWPPATNQDYALLQAIDALDFRIPRPLAQTATKLVCPRCRRHITNRNCRRSSIEYCPKCGQRLDWANTNIEQNPQYNLHTYTFTVNYERD